MQLREQIDSLAEALGQQAVVGVHGLLDPLLDGPTLCLLEPSVAHVSSAVRTAFQEALLQAVLPDLQRIVALGGGAQDAHGCISSPGARRPGQVATPSTPDTRISCMPGATQSLSARSSMAHSLSQRTPSNDGASGSNGELETMGGLANRASQAAEDAANLAPLRGILGVSSEYGPGVPTDANGGTPYPESPRSSFNSRNGMGGTPHRQSLARTSLPSLSETGDKCSIPDEERAIAADTVCRRTMEAKPLFDSTLDGVVSGPTFLKGTADPFGGQGADALTDQDHAILRRLSVDNMPLRGGGALGAYGGFSCGGNERVSSERVAEPRPVSFSGSGNERFGNELRASGGYSGRGNDRLGVEPRSAPGDSTGAGDDAIAAAMLMHQQIEQQQQQQQQQQAGQNAMLQHCASLPASAFQQMFQQQHQQQQSQPPYSPNAPGNGSFLSSEQELLATLAQTMVNNGNGGLLTSPVDFLRMSAAPVGRIGSRQAADSFRSMPATPAGSSSIQARSIDVFHPGCSGAHPAANGGGIMDPEFSPRSFNGNGLGMGGGSGGSSLPTELPPRFKALPDTVCERIKSLLSAANSVIGVRDFDEKVVNKMGVLVELHGMEEALSMLTHLEHRMRTKQGVMKNGPGYLDVAVSSHLDMLRAQGSCPKSMTTEEYAAHTLNTAVMHELREAVSNNKWLEWAHLDQGIIQLIKKLPRSSAIEKLQEISYHSFKNVDNIKGCIMSILNCKIREDRRRL